MKRKTLLLLFGIIVLTVNGQSPQAFQYQAVLRSETGTPLSNQQVSVKMSILSDTILNVVEYAEIHDIQTDNFGRVNIKVGEGDVLSGGFGQISWADGQYFIRIGFDQGGGTQYQNLGQARLLSVPYALYANSSGEEYTAGQGIEITAGNMIENTGDLSEDNEIQTLSRLGNAIILSPAGGSVIDSDKQTLSMQSAGTQRQIQISGGNSVSIDVADNDNNSLNELQVISVSNDTIFLSNGGFAKLPVPTNAQVPEGGCIQSLDPLPPEGYVYSGTGFTAGDQWDPLPSMANARFGPVAIAHQNKIYVIGGWQGLGNVSNKVEVYDLETKAWSTKANMTTGVVYAAAALVDNKIHVMGGYNGSAVVSTHQVYDIQNNSWSTSTALAPARSGCGAANIEGKIYLIGGFANGMASNLNQMFDPQSNSWTGKATMPTARTDFALAALYDGVYAIGGWGTDALNVNEFYHPATNSWTTYYPLPEYRSGCSSVVAENKIFVIGGGDAYSFASATLTYDPLANSWSSKTSIPSPRSYFGAVSINDLIYIAGGNFGGALNSFLEYNPATLQFYIHCVE